jgi:hypothetical protein
MWKKGKREKGVKKEGFWFGDEQMGSWSRGDVNWIELKEEAGLGRLI